MADKSEIDMDAEAEKADAALHTLDEHAVRAVALWWKSHYMKVGHKRLARVLLATVKDSK